MDNNDFKFLKNFILFSELNDKELQDIYNLMETKTYPDDCTIFFEGEKGDRVFFLKKGQVKVIKTSRNGDEQILEIIKPGDVFGEVVLFDITEFPATTVTKGEVEVDYLTRDRFKKYFNEHPMIGWGMLKVMSRKLTRSQHKIKNLGLRNTKGRVARLIIDMINDFGDYKDVTIDFNQQELASFIGTSRETVSRTLSQFRKKGLIKIDGNKLTIIDREGLEKVL